MFYFDIPELSLDSETRENFIMDTKSGLLEQLHEEPFLFYGSDDREYFSEYYNMFTIEPTCIYILQVSQGWDVAPHIDADYEQARNTTCIIPLYPEGDEYMPCDFVDRSGEMIESIGWKEHGFMMTTRKLHRVISNKYDRLNLQITFKEPIEELYELYKEDKLIRKQ